MLSRYESATSFYTALFIVELYYSIFLHCIVFFLDCKLLIDYCYMQSAVELSEESDCFVFLITFHTFTVIQFYIIYLRVISYQVTGYNNEYLDFHSL